MTAHSCILLSAPKEGCSGLPRYITRVTALRATALTLQRALLPTDLPSTTELEVAVRNVAGAADPNIGGDW